jgi:hypothetical protein
MASSTLSVDSKRRITNRLCRTPTTRSSTCSGRSNRSDVSDYSYSPPARGWRVYIPAFVAESPRSRSSSARPLLPKSERTIGLVPDFVTLDAIDRGPHAALTEKTTWRVKDGIPTENVGTSELETYRHRAPLRRDRAAFRHEANVRTRAQETTRTLHLCTSAILYS